MRNLRNAPARLWLSMLVALAVLLLSSACDLPAPPVATPTPLAPSSSGGAVQDQPSLVDALRKAGLNPMPTSTISQPFLSGSGTVITVGSESLQVFEYDDAAAAASDAAKIPADANIPGYAISWVAQPHFYRAGKIIVIYPGADQNVLTALAAVLGAPFAVGQ